MKRALVLGLARSGRAAQAALEARGTEVVAADRTLGNDDDLSLLDGADVLVKSPGVPGEAPLVVGRPRARDPRLERDRARRRACSTTRSSPITGTKGKTTTSELLGRILDAPVAGNVGRALTELVGDVEPGRPIVCEVSSFQLEDVHELAPAVAILLNLERDHLDRHGTTRGVPRGEAPDLRETRARTTWPSCRVGSGRSPAQATTDRVLRRRRAARRAAASRGRTTARTRPRPSRLRGRGGRTRPRSRPGCAASRASRTASRRSRRSPASATSTTRWRRTSSPSAAALRTFDAPVHLILGGRPKGEPFDELARLVAESSVVTAYLIGEAADALAVDLGYASVPFLLATTLERAVAEAASAAEPGHVVLLSPACASYDQFRDFEHRGEEFRRLVENLQG